MDEAYLELSASAIDDIRHDSHFKFFYPTYFIVQQVRHAASFDHVCLKLSLEILSLQKASIC